MYKVEKSGREEMRYLIRGFFFFLKSPKKFKQTSVSDWCKQERMSRGVRV